MQQRIVRLLAQPEVKESFVRLGAEARASTPEAFAGQIRAEMGKWAALVKSMGLLLEESRKHGGRRQNTVLV